MTNITPLGQAKQQNTLVKKITLKTMHLFELETLKILLNVRIRGRREDGFHNTRVVVVYHILYNIYFCYQEERRRRRMTIGATTTRTSTCLLSTVAVGTQVRWVRCCCCFTMQQIDMGIVVEEIWNNGNRLRYMYCREFFIYIFD